ncbi:MAG: hypothetical protein A2X94_06165 [Bdellovibrionales bacterium GWB1_55_8]|nr:MAG: hypothetical protein A2X94_06165 [Bdellovibrionales bacterium GWB1_55_8]
MVDDLFAKPPKRGTLELNLVPIIDMLTSVIFFILLSTTFVAFTKVTVPPSRVISSTDPLAPPPVAPKVFLVRNQEGYSLSMLWGGAEPGEETKDITIATPGELPESLRSASLELSKNFHAKYPLERSVQLGLGSDVPYQGLISIMDGIRENVPDIVLVSYDEADRNRTSKRDSNQDGGS